MRDEGDIVHGHDDGRPEADGSGIGRRKEDVQFVTRRGYREGQLFPRGTRATGYAPVSERSGDAVQKWRPEPGGLISG